MRLGQTFTQGCPAHWAAVGVILGTCVALARPPAGATRSPAARRTIDAWLAIALLAIVAAVQIRYLMPDRLRWSWSLPLQVCNVAAMVGPVAVWKKAPYFRAILYHFGLGICSIALVAPMLHEGVTRPDFWLFWTYHGGITVAAVYDFTVGGYRPSWRDWRWNAASIAAFVVSVFSVDLVLHANYGFLGNDPHDAALVQAFGRWPVRVVWLALTAMVTTAAACLIGQWELSRVVRPMAGGSPPSPRAYPIRPPGLLVPTLRDAA